MSPEASIAGDEPAINRMWSRLRDVMRKSGIAESDPIVPILIGMCEMAESVGETAERHSASVREENAQLVRSMDEIVSSHIELGKVDRERLKAAADLCQAETRKLEKTYGTLEIRTDHRIAEMIDRMVVKVSEEVRKRTVIVENRHNTWKLLIAASIWGAVLVGAGVAGYLYCWHVDAPALAFNDHCATTASQDTATGRYVCYY